MPESLSRDEWERLRDEAAAAFKWYGLSQPTERADAFMRDRYGECPPEPPPSFAEAGWGVRVNYPRVGISAETSLSPSEAQALEDAIRTCREWCERQEAGS